MRYDRVCLESIGYVLPDEVVSSTEIEHRLAPIYQRLRLPEGRLELMTGIQERRFWRPGTLPSEKSVLSAELAMRASGVDKRRIGSLIHASVCRDFLEPATACGVHHRLGLSPECVVYDVSNACLGILNGMLQVANMIELRQIQAGLVVGTEGSRQLVENTIDALNGDASLTRDRIKSAVASLTIGSASCAVLLVDRDLSQTGNRIVAASGFANTRFHDLCHSGADEAAAGGMQPLMKTDSEKLMREGIATGAAAFERFLAEAKWSREAIAKSCCHQVGSSHRKLMLESLGLDPATDYTTLEWLGNTGSVALPVTLALAAQHGHVGRDEHIGLLGIGSGINCLMIGVNWQESRVAGCCEDGSGSAELACGPMRSSSPQVTVA